MIRQATQEDLNSLLPLLHQLFTIEKDFVFDAEKQAKGLRLLISSPSSVIMVAEDQGLIIGMATGQLFISTAEGEVSLLIEDVAVKPSHQFSGIGSRLLQSLGDWGADHGANRMQLLADQTNHQALSFYGKRGWQKTELICLRKFHRGAQ